MKQYQFMTHLELLGAKVQDRVTNYAGIVTAVKFDLFGCIQALVVKKLAPDDTEFDSRYFDVSRLAKIRMPALGLYRYDPDTVLEKLQQLGCTACSLIHEFEGTISSLSFEGDGRVYGYLALCKDDFKKIEGDWTPYCFLSINSHSRVMPAPVYNYTEPEIRAQDTAAGRSGSNDVPAPRKF